MPSMSVSSSSRLIARPNGPCLVSQQQVVDPDEYIGEPGLGIDVVHLGRYDQPVLLRGPVTATPRPLEPQ